MTWDIHTSHCSYDGESPFGKVIEKLCSMPGVTQEDIDILESMATERTNAVRELASIRVDTSRQ